MVGTAVVKVSIDSANKKMAPELLVDWFKHRTFDHVTFTTSYYHINVWPLD
jgi:hypothetical protein